MIIDHSSTVEVPDYEADDVLVVSEPEQLRALGDDVRTRIVMLLRRRAASTTELAGALGLAKGTIAHHLKTLERAGLVRVVRTRKVRAMTERFYGRTARLFVIKSGDPVTAEGPGAAAAAGLFRAAAEEVATAPPGASAVTALRVRLRERDAQRFARRFERLARDLVAAQDGRGSEYTFAGGIFPTPEDAR